MDQFIKYFDFEQSEYHLARHHKKLEVKSSELLSLADQQLSKFSSKANKNLRAIYSNLTRYSSIFKLFMYSESSLVYLPHEKFIGKPHESPVPLLQEMIHSTSEIYFYPANKRFVGLLRTIQPEILQLAMPGVGMRLWEMGGYYSIDTGKSYLDVTIQLDLDIHTCINPDSLREDDITTRDNVFKNLEFLLGFIPKKTPKVIDTESSKQQLLNT